MSQSSCSYLVKRSDTSNAIYILNKLDIGISRRIYIGLDDEYFKALKALKWINLLDKSSKEKDISNFLDIGANIGNVTIPLLVQNLIQNAVLWEPMKENFKLLKANIILNNLENRVKIYNKALGETFCEVDLELSEDNFGDHRIHKIDCTGKYNEHLRVKSKVQMADLDSYEYLYSKNQLNLIWLDVQGYEGGVLSGAKQILSHNCYLVLEFWPYGINRARQYENLTKGLMIYNSFYDLSESKPIKRPLHLLDKYYNNNFNDDYFSRDLLFIKNH